jgi:Tol biopolymer transport system component
MAMANESVSPRFSIIHLADGTRTAVELPVEVHAHDWLPTGDEIVLVGQTPTRQWGIYAVQPDGSAFRTVVEPSGTQIEELTVSDDGRYIAYNTFTGSGGELHLVELATGVDSAEPATFGVWNLGPRFSPDGSLHCAA